MHEPAYQTVMLALESVPGTAAGEERVNIFSRVFAAGQRCGRCSRPTTTPFSPRGGSPESRANVGLKRLHRREKTPLMRTEKTLRMCS